MVDLQCGVDRAPRTQEYFFGLFGAKVFLRSTIPPVMRDFGISAAGTNKGGRRCSQHFYSNGRERVRAGLSRAAGRRESRSSPARYETDMKTDADQGVAATPSGNREGEQEPTWTRRLLPAPPSPSWKKSGGKTRPAPVRRAASRSSPFSPSGQVSVFFRGH